MKIAFQQFNKSATIITPNRRLAATFTKKHHQYQIEQGLKSWESLDILPFTSWIQRFWQNFLAEGAADTPSLLNTDKEAALWEEILQKNAPDTLLQISKTAEIAKSALGILQQWQIPLDHHALSLTEDSRVFLTWATLFAEKCKTEDWLTLNALPQYIAQKIEEGVIQPPAEMMVIGFTEFTPSQTAFFNTCETHGARVTILENFTDKNSDGLFSRKISLEDTEKEIETMARFAKKHCQAGVTDAPTIACIVPHLEKMRDRVSQIFLEIFQDPALFNISAGKSLNHYPIIHMALMLLRLYDADISHQNFSEILSSPFLGDAEKEYHARANFDERLRRANMTTDILKQILQPHSKIFLEKYCPRLFDRINKFKSRTLKKTHTLHEWVEIFMELLTILGWPGERSLHSHEYQVVQRFLNLLNDFRQLDDILPPKTFHEALHHLTLQTSHTVFQPESHDAPVQILGMLEAADIPFDYIWVMHMDDASFPPTAKPNPFIPNVLQRKYRMPHANADRELNYSLRLLTQLKRSTNHLIFSYARTLNDCESFPSALIQSIPEITLEELQLENFTPTREIIFHSQQIETYQDETAPILLADEKIRGGVNILKQQAACPFKAFAEIRLHAEKLPTPTLGLRADERGVIVHKALELIWKKLETSQNLQTSTEKDLKILIKSCILDAMAAVTQLDESRYLTLESDRMQSILWDWLQLEKNRPAFKIGSVEEKREITIGPLSLTLRIDRIDELSDGSHLIIDYKTSKDNTPKYWFSDRPDEPQLPLYCITYAANTEGIAFAEIQAKNLALKGISKNALDIKTMVPFAETNFTENKTWDEQLKSWREILEKISTDFYHGVAAVDPKDPAETCQYCHLKSLCRIHEGRV